MKSTFLLSYILFFIMISISMKSYGQYTEKQLKRLDKMDIKTAIYAQEVNEPVVSRILVLDRSHPKTLIPGILLNVVAAWLFVTLINYNNGSPAIIAPLVTLGTVAVIGSIPLYTFTIIKRRKRNKLIKQLKS